MVRYGLANLGSLRLQLARISPLASIPNGHDSSIPGQCETNVASSAAPPCAPSRLGIGHQGDPKEEIGTKGTRTEREGGERQAPDLELFMLSDIGGFAGPPATAKQRRHN
ncbi:hypothetical protein BHE74_00048251 [Ensete ventricosum]|nr:hypothetical protein BHE74_00048251 [Ensete ventricosum]